MLSCRNGFMWDGRLNDSNRALFKLFGLGRLAQLLEQIKLIFHPGIAARLYFVDTWHLGARLTKNCMEKTKIKIVLVLKKLQGPQMTCKETSSIRSMDEENNMSQSVWFFRKYLHTRSHNNVTKTSMEAEFESEIIKRHSSPRPLLPPKFLGSNNFPGHRLSLPEQQLLP
ncbi:unnamed protein product [Prunus armeniaca]